MFIHNSRLGVTRNGCTAYEHRCRFAGLCIPSEWICDGEIDCAYTASDEAKCQGNFYQDSSPYSKLNIIRICIKNNLILKNEFHFLVNYMSY